MDTTKLEKWLQANIRILNKTTQIPTIESKDGIYFVKNSENSGLYVVSTRDEAKQIHKIFNTEDYDTSEEVTQKINQQISELGDFLTAEPNGVIPKLREYIDGQDELLDEKIDDLREHVDTQDGLLQNQIDGLSSMSSRGEFSTYNSMINSYTDISPALQVGQFVAVTEDSNPSLNGLYKYTGLGNFSFVSGMGDLSGYVKYTGEQNKTSAEKKQARKNIGAIGGIRVEGNIVSPDSEGVVDLPDAPVQGIRVNGTEEVPDENGIIDVIIPDAPIQEISLNGDKQEPDEHGKVSLTVVTETEDTIDPFSDLPVKSRAIAAEFEAQRAVMGTQVKLIENGDGDSKTYSIALLNENDETLSTTDEFSGGGGGGSDASTKIVLVKLSTNATIKVGDPMTVSFSYDHIDTTSQTSTGLTAKLKTTVIAGATSNTIEETIGAGTTQNIEVGKFFVIGSNSVRVRVEVNNGETIQVSTLAWNFQVVDLKLSSTFDVGTITNKGSNLNIPYTLKGSGNKELSVYVNYTLFQTISIATSNATGQISIPTSSYSHGNLNVQMVALLEAENIYSNSIYIDAIIAESGNNSRVIGARFGYQDGSIIPQGQRPYINTRQYEQFSIVYSAYAPGLPQKTVTIEIDNEEITSAEVGSLAQYFTYKHFDSGNLQGVIKTGNVNYTFGLNVEEINLNLTEPTDSLVFKFDTRGKSNSNKTDREQWLSTDGNTQAIMQNVGFSSDGWVNGAFRLKGSGRVVVDYKPLDETNKITLNSWTLQFKIKTSTVNDNEETTVVSMLDGALGLRVKTNEVSMTTKDGKRVEMKLAPDNIYNIAIVSHPEQTQGSSQDEIVNNRMLLLYIDGIIVGGLQRGSSDSIYQVNPKQITFGSNDAVTDIYNIRHYNRYLSDDQILALHMLDLDTVDSLLHTYDRNDLLDGEGNITVDNVPDDVRYIVITGKAQSGMETVLEAARINSKNAYYNVAEMLHIKKSQPELNWRLTGGAIRLQGTSSMAYPIKNYRIYMYNSNKEPGQLYTGCDSQGIGGVLQENAKWSFKLANEKGKIPAPVNCWCLKADYAESSGSHNTGMAKLVNDTLVAVNELTPAQKHVDSNFQNDVRTTVDGEPCYLFYRGTVNDTPIFLGKYNFNNDKSTEAVFGFEDIPGYHDAAWVNDKFGGENPTECWEFLNNDYPMGSFLDDDFNTKVDNIPNWLNVFESRFPDNNTLNDQYKAGTLKPYYLERLVKWVKSTQNNSTKFKNELADYFDVNYLCDYYILTELMGAVDQRVKNVFLGFWYNPEKDKMLGYLIFYDNDTILGVRNDGELKYGWDIDHDTYDEELFTYAFMGHNSVLWNNLTAEFAPEIKMAYERIRSQMSNDKIFAMFDTEQSDKFSEVVYNKDSYSKYIKPLTVGLETIESGQPVIAKYNYIKSMQGSRKSHRRWWLTNRLRKFDAKYATGRYSATDITWKGTSQPGAVIKATPIRDYYFQLVRESQSMAHNQVFANTEWSYTYNEEAAIGTVFHLLGGDFMLKLNISNWGQLSNFNFTAPLPMLEELIMGKDGENKTFNNLAIEDKLPRLKRFDIRNHINIVNLDLRTFSNLTELNTRGCTSLSKIDLPSSAPLTSLILPQNLVRLTLDNFVELEEANIQFPDGNGIKEFVYKNTPGVDWEDYLENTLVNVTHIRIEGINRKGDLAWLEQFYDYKGIDEQGNTVNTPRLVGTYKLNTYLEEGLDDLQNKFPELIIRQPDYSTIEFTEIDGGIGVSQADNVSNLDNETGYLFNNAYEPSGHIKEILNRRHRYLCGRSLDEANVMHVLRLHDHNSNLLADGVTNVSAYINSDTLLGNMGVYIWEGKDGAWVKGINDYRNGKKYALFSSNPEAPTVAPHAKITLAQLSGAGKVVDGKAINTNISYQTLAEAITNRSGSSYIEVDVSNTDYKQVRFPTVAKDVGGDGAIFVDNNGDIIKKVVMHGSRGALDGHYIFLDIPAGSKKLYFTINNSVQFDYVLLTESEELEAIEPDWVKIDDYLCGAYKGNITGGILKSKAGVIPTNNISQANFEAAAKTSGSKHQLIDMQMHNYGALLFYAKYGHRDSQGQCGTSGSFNTGSTNTFGMRDTVRDPSGTNAQYPSGTNVYRLNCVGYESFFGEKFEWMSNVGSNTGYKVSIDEPDGTTRVVQAVQLAVHYPKFMTWGKHCDLISSADGGSDATYYYDQFTGSSSTNRVFARSGSSTHTIGGVACLNASLDSSYTGMDYSSRPAFRGEIREAKSLVEFLSHFE